MTVTTKTKERTKKSKRPSYERFGDFKGELLEHMGHEDFVVKLVSSLHHRDDAKHLFFTSIFRNGLTWGILVGTSLVVSALVVRFSDVSIHIVEKAINSQVPELIPPRESAKAE